MCDDGARAWAEQARITPIRRLLLDPEKLSIGVRFAGGDLGWEVIVRKRDSRAMVSCAYDEAPTEALRLAVLAMPTCEGANVHLECAHSNPWTTNAQG